MPTPAFDPAARRRTLALGDATDHCRRAAAAALAATAGELDVQRRGVLVDAHRRLLGVLSELAAWT